VTGSRGDDALAIAVARDVDGIVADAARAAFAGSSEVGMQVAVCRGDDVIVDVSVGYADADRRPVESSTLFPVFSVTKGLVSSGVLRACDEGLLELGAPIADYWPQFAGAGKSGASVADLLTHSVGIPAMPDGATVEQMCDWQHMVQAVERMTPIWSPGTATGYHAYTYGWIAGELLRRVRGDAGTPAATMNAVLADLGVTDFWIGLPDTEADRVATLYTAPSGPRPAPTPLFARALPSALRPQPAVFNRAEVRRACLPAAGGIGTATALARLYGALAAQAVDGRQGAREPGGGGAVPLRASTVRRAAELRTDAEDRVLGQRVRKGLGFFLDGPDNPQTVPMGRHAAFGHPGSGGSTAWADTTLGVGIAITKNWMARPDEPSILTLAEAARTAAERAPRPIRKETPS
jgi:CubicO group peptidase (beta-lactamase class C family)